MDNAPGNGQGLLYNSASFLHFSVNLQVFCVFISDPSVTDINNNCILNNFRESFIVQEIPSFDIDYY